MGNCETCGSEGNLVLSLIEGVELKVCKQCSSFGQKVKKPDAKRIMQKIMPTKKQDTEIIQIITQEYPRLIRKKREKMGLKQKEFAKFLAERESLIHKMESGTYTPSIELARKLERQLGISLVEQKEVKTQKLEKKASKFTIGDIIKIK